MQKPSLAATRRRPCARPRAVDPTVRSLKCGRGDQEVPIAGSAFSSDGPRLRSIGPGYKKFARLNCLRSARVARSARRDQVFRGVVKRVVVDMVGDQTVNPVPALSNTPLHTMPAPVAVVKTRTDLVVEHCSGFTDEPGFPGQWVIELAPYAPMGRRSLSACGICAVLGAIQPRLAGRSAVRDSAVVTG